MSLLPRIEIREWRLEILTTDHWLLCNEIATARQVGPRNDTMLRVPTDDRLLGLEIRDWSNKVLRETAKTTVVSL